MTHSFPTRRSSELIAPGNAGCGRHAHQDSVRLCHVTTQQGFDAIATIHRIVVVKMQLRHRAQLEHLAEAETDFARSEEHTSELQSLMRISYAVFCLKKKNK